MNKPKHSECQSLGASNTSGRDKALTAKENPDTSG
jgi:hypothetical protein